ncbi:MAG: STAS/SEC14 domain-containing protein [Proteobacteria bacterium]|nr:STAS/SEC14 domain-containing protein [Pseudomonadota bacterium]
MLEIKPERERNIIFFRAVGTLTEADYVDVFVPAMTALLQEHPKFRLYCDLSRLLGWDEKSQWETGAILASNVERCERAAIVGGPSWAGLTLLLRDSLPPGHYELYTDGNQVRALAWIRAAL